MTPATNPAGSWDARVARPRGVTPVVVHFTTEGQVFLLSGGAGRWSADPSGRFRFEVAEPIVGERGGYAGWVRIEQEAVLDPVAGRFTSRGRSTVHGVDGIPAYTADITIVAQRTVETHRVA